MCRIHILSKARTQAATLKMLTRRKLVHVPKRLKVQTSWESRLPVDTVTSCMADRRRRSLINHLQTPHRRCNSKILVYKHRLTLSLSLRP